MQRVGRPGVMAPVRAISGRALQARDPLAFTAVNERCALPASIATISEAESVVMDVIWRRGAVTAGDVFDEIKGRTRWQESTVKTLLNRLLKKHAITAEKHGRRYLYQASMSREARLSLETLGLIDRLFQGRLALFVLHYAAHRRLSKQDVTELKRAIEELGEGE